MTKAQLRRQRIARRKAVRKKAEDAAYARGDCIECYRPHSNVHPVTRQPTRICALCQGKRTDTQRQRREDARHIRDGVVTALVLVPGRTVLGQP